MLRRPKTVDPKVLIVDPSTDNQEVLCAALASRGMEALAALDLTEGLRQLSEADPDLIVLDVESIPEGSLQSSEFETATQRFGHRLIALGAIRRQSDRFGGGSFVAKPYHYAPLIRTIEGLLARSKSTASQ